MVVDRWILIDSC